MSVSDGVGEFGRFSLTHYYEYGMLTQTAGGKTRPNEPYYPLCGSTYSSWLPRRLDVTSLFKQQNCAWRRVVNGVCVLRAAEESQLCVASAVVCYNKSTRHTDPRFLSELEGVCVCG